MNRSIRQISTFDQSVPAEEFDKLAKILRRSAELEEEIRREGPTRDRLEGLRSGQREWRNLLRELASNTGSGECPLIRGRSVQLAPPHVVATRPPQMGIMR
jgi:hypothetical protein